MLKRKAPKSKAARSRIACRPMPDKPGELKFKVGSRTYTVRIVPAPLMFEGNEVYATCAGIGEIKISTMTEPKDRLSVLFHEIGHAYLWERCPGLDDESLCDAIEGVGMI